MRVLGVTDTDHIGACEAYRCVYPLAEMRNQGHKISLITRKTSTELAQKNIPFWNDFDIIMFQRIVAEEENVDHFYRMPLAIRATGTSVIIDYDDDYTNKHREVHDKSLPNLKSMSAITVSTPYLKRVMEGQNRSVAVIPNLVPLEMFSGFTRTFDSKIIGLSGSKSHDRDWKIVVEPLKRLAAKYDFKVFVTGFVPDYLRELPNLLTLADVAPEKKLSNKDVDAFIPLEQCGNIYASIDIMLCPVDPDDRFSWAKSNLKALEAQASTRDVGGRVGGCAVVASGDLPIYQNAIVNHETGVLVKHHDESAWERGIERLLTDIPYVQRMQVAGYESVKKNFNIKTRVCQRVAAYRDIIERDRRRIGSTVAGVAALLNEEKRLEPVMA